MTVSSEPLGPSSVIAGRYQIHRLLGQGGMSRVYLATDLRLNVQVAIKENLQTAPEAREQFIREAQILARLSHPSLPRVSDHLEDTITERQYLVMDYIEGQDLNVMVKRLGHLPEATAVAWIQQVLDALEYLHSQNPPVIHRDIKPSNIKITPSGKAVLVDFGLAKTIEGEGQTMTGARSVTPGYAPPEQYGQRTDTRSDIYALGATLYTLLTGRVPPESTLRTSNIMPLIPPHQVTPDISPAVEAAILCAMDVDTQRRWQSATAFKAALAASAAPPVDVTDKTTAAGPDFKPITPPAPGPSMPPTVEQKRPAPPELDRTMVGSSAEPGAAIKPATGTRPDAGKEKPSSVVAPPAVARPNTLPESSPLLRMPPGGTVSHAPTVGAVPQVPREQRRKGFPVFAVIVIVLVLAVLGAGGWFVWQEMNRKTIVVVVPYPTDTPAPASPSALPGIADGTATAQFLALSLATPTTAMTSTSAASSTPVPATNTTAPSATRLSATATSMPPTATRPRPTATQVPPTAVPAPTATSVPRGPATVAVVSVRIDPTDTRRNQQVTFYVTFRNTFTTPQQRRWGVKISYADDGRKMGDTAPSTVEFPVGDSEWPSANNWGVNGKGDQLSLVARIVYVGLDGSFTYVPDLNGNDNAYGFVVKP